MSCCDGTDPACPCGVFVHPQVISNPPGQTALAARSGDYVAYRRALLQVLPGETELSRTDGTTTTLLWRPSAEGDLALQMIEWWAYLSDILTFYNERVTNESYLRTALLPESVHRLIGLLGYRPRPALGAHGTLAALVNRARPVVLPHGLQIQSKPGPGKSPQIFEVDADTTVSRPDAALAMPAPQPPASFITSPAGSSPTVLTLLVAGRLGTVKKGDELLLVKVGWDGTTDEYAAGIVQSLADQVAPGGAHNTSVAFTVTSQTQNTSQLTPTTAASWRLLKSGGTATLYPYLSDTKLTHEHPNQDLPPFVVDAHLASVFRQISAGDLVLIDDRSVPSVNPAYLGIVTGYTETIYYANNPNHPDQPPAEVSPNANIPAVPILHSVITFQTPDTVTGDATTTVVGFGWKDVGHLIDIPATTVSGSSAGGITTGNPPASAAAGASGGQVAGAVNASVLVEDTNGEGAAATIDGNGNLTLDPSAPTLVPPLTVLFNLVGVSRGKSVVNEVLGSGDSTILNQDFTLQKAPVTYFADGTGISGEGYSSTVQVSVDRVQWQEVASFFGQLPTAPVFITREDESGNTHVIFGDGVCGRRLPTGVNNIIANYRYGAGAEVPDPSTLVSVLQPQPGLASLVNPVAPSGGADADSASKIRTLAPKSVLTFGRAVSLDDYQTLAAGAAGVTTAQASYVFDPLAQRPTVHVWVVGDADAAHSAIAAAADPNRPFKVDAAKALTLWLALTYVRDPRFADPAVRQGIHDALLDPDQGFFGSARSQIGKAFSESDICAACLAVPGVVAVHGITVSVQLTPTAPAAVMSTSEQTTPPCVLERYNPGDGCYFALPDDGVHLSLNAELPS